MPLEEAGPIALETADIETSSDGYASRFNGPVGDWFLEVQARAVLSILGHPSDAGTLLDVGGGHGQLAWPLAARGFQVTVAGSSPECANRIASLVAKGRCRFQACNLLRLPFADRSFETALCFRYISHCRRWRDLVSELCRVSSKNVIIDYPPMASLNVLYPMFFRLKKLAEGNTRTFEIFRDRDLFSEFARWGFQPALRIGQFTLPMVVHRKLRNRELSRLIESFCRRIGLTSRYGSPVVLEMRRSEGSDGR